MLKIILTLISLMLFKNQLQITIFTLSMIMLTFMIKMTWMKAMIFDKMFFNDNLSWTLIMLTLFMITLTILSSMDFKSMSMKILIIMILLILTFSSTNILMFYILFELVLIPTMMLIMKFGSQPERLQASIYLMLYTILASLPLLINIIILKTNLSFPMLLNNNFMFNMVILFMLAFMVKMPMFMTHLWLPKAHVEAPLEGSMILAAILLKLGGFGLIRVIPMCLNSIYKINYWIMSISMVGATLTSMNCIRQKDIKSLIAYSSIAHMGFVLMGIFSLNYMGMTGAMIMMIAHGMSSSAMFLLANDIYMKYHSRNISMFKGLLILSPNISFWWFIFMMINLSAPPTINTLSEIFIMSSVILLNKTFMIMIFMISITVTSFSMVLFNYISHNKNKMVKMNLFTMNKIYLSLLLHMIPLISILTKIEIMEY